MEKFFKGKKILIAGISGFVGRNLALKLENYNVKIIGTYHSKKPKFVSKKIKLLKLDLTIKKNCLKACKNIDYVFMCAANSSGAQIIEKKPLTHLTPNLIMNSLILEAAYEMGVKKLCFISSSTVYPLRNKTIREKDVNYKFFEKYFIVGWMKLFSEKICQMYSEKIEKPMQTLIVRPSNLYGPHDKFDWKTAKVVPSLIRKVVEKKFPVVIWGNGKDLKDFIYIDDFINALLKLFILKKKINPINISSGKSYTIRQMFSILEKISDQKKIEIRYDKSKPTMIPKRKISNQYLRQISSWKPKIDLETGIKNTYNWYKKNKR